MIPVRTIMNARPEKQKELIQTLLSMIDPAGKEKGCLSYDVYYDIEGIKSVQNMKHHHYEYSIL